MVNYDEYGLGHVRASSHALQKKGLAFVRTDTEFVDLKPKHLRYASQPCVD